MNNDDKVLIAPSILSANFARLGEEVKAVQEAGADWIHVDVMDGMFVPNITIGPLVVDALKKINPPPLDVHLMIEKPERYIEDFVKAGADFITVHQETCPHLHRTIMQIKDAGAKASVSINPSTPVSSLEEVLHLVDMILLMSVNPGFGGQKFIPSVREKCAILSEARERLNLDFYIEIDGGVNASNAADLIDAGADVLVAGSAVFGKDDYQSAIEALKNAQSS